MDANEHAEDKNADASALLRRVAALLEGHDPLELLSRLDELGLRRAALQAQADHDERMRKVLYANINQHFRERYAGKSKTEAGAKLTEKVYDNLTRQSKNYTDHLRTMQQSANAYYQADAAYWRLKSTFDYLMKALDLHRSEIYATKHA